VDSGFQALDSAFLVSETWILDSSRYPGAEFRIPRFQDSSPKPRISVSASKNFPDYLTWSDFIAVSFVFVYIVIICHNQNLSAEPNMEKKLRINKCFADERNPADYNRWILNIYSYDRSCCKAKSNYSPSFSYRPLEEPPLKTNKQKQNDKS